MRYSLCSFCKYRHTGTATCDAYPERIPQKFLGGAEHHVFPEEGDHGRQFEPAADLPEECRRIALRIVTSVKAAPGAAAGPQP